ncbi:hypothetical protein GQ55_1G222600 [Panicum hallii var. hallii]|uniref:HAT C-terminal dimerisation domain-containing protein n=1 Tax=Panicum hallii var. hallii TaxID=1504633 RepID=A0A2T7F6K4_9POAL|nr:hypothetical protein GQ55_1G222600 [Panicum hallii var. hallii]
MLIVFKSFEFDFLLHLMNEKFGYTNNLCNALQKREEDAGWEEFLKKVTFFCEKHKVKVVHMNGKYVPMQRSKQFFRGAVNYHRFHAGIFLGIIDRQVQELNNRFDELAGFYPHDFGVEEMNQLSFQLNHYINDVRNDEDFTNLRSLAELSIMLVKTIKVSRYDLVYKLLKLVLVLATAGVERIFSIMNLIKKKLAKK